MNLSKLTTFHCIDQVVADKSIQNSDYIFTTLTNNPISVFVSAYSSFQNKANAPTPYVISVAVV